MKQQTKLTTFETKAWWSQYGKLIEAQINEMRDAGLPDDDASWREIQSLMDDYWIHSRKKFLSEKKAAGEARIKITPEAINQLVDNKYHLCWGDLYSAMMKDCYFDDIPFPTAQAVEISHPEGFSVFPKIKPQKKYWKKRLYSEPLYIDYFKREADGCLTFGKHIPINSTWQEIIPTILNVYEASGDYHHCFLENLRLSDDNKVIHIECGS